MNIPFLLRRRSVQPAFDAAARLRETVAGILPAEHLGRVFPPYRTVFIEPGPFTDAGHARLAAMPEEGGLLKAETPGFLRPADALLLYELAWHAPGNMLELGSAWGLSATILCRAVRNAGRGARVTSVEIDPAFQQATIRAVAALGLRDHLDPRPGAADAVLRRLISERQTFSVAFVDHDHAFAAVAEASRQLSTLLRPGGIAVFHDFNDERNVTEPGTYGVYPAVCDMVRRREWRYLGIMGCCALVQRTIP